MSQSLDPWKIKGQTPSDSLIIIFTIWFYFCKKLGLTCSFLGTTRFCRWTLFLFALLSAFNFANFAKKTNKKKHQFDFLIHPAMEYFSHSKLRINQSRRKTWLGQWCMDVWERGRKRRTVRMIDSWLITALRRFLDNHRAALCCLE